MTLSAGTRLGPYVVVGPLVAGGMGEVYRGRDARLGRDCDQVLPSDVSSAGSLRRSRGRRGRLGLNHPAIVPIYASGRTRVYPGSLGRSSKARQSGASTRDHSGQTCLQLGTAIADGLARARRGYVHRD